VTASKPLQNRNDQAETLFEASLPKHINCGNLLKLVMHNAIRICIAFYSNLPRTASALVRRLTSTSSGAFMTQGMPAAHIAVVSFDNSFVQQLVLGAERTIQSDFPGFGFIGNGT